MKQRKAFTLFELIIVIVILGIIGKFGTEFLAKAYHSFISTQLNNSLQSKSELAVEFISKRLENRIKKSASAYNTTTSARTYLLGGTDENASMLEWIAADVDSFRGNNQPLYSGVIDLEASSAASLISPGSDFDAVGIVEQKLSNSNTDINDSAIYFLDSRLSTSNPWGFEGNITDQTHTMHPINATGNTIVPNGGSFSGVEISEYYKLSWTANAVSLENIDGTTHMGDLYFYYDYQPWQGETYLAGKKVLLANGISAFRFRSAGALIKIQICAKTALFDDEEYALCKEKTIE